MTLDSRIHAFIAAEAHMLDTGAWDEWQDLFTPDGMYWMPATPQQTSPHTHVSLMYESAMLRGLRIDRLKKRDGLSVEGTVRTVHHVSNILAEQQAGSSPSARAMVHCVEYVNGETRDFHGHTQWTFMDDRQAGLKLHLKRVDLINADGVTSDILSFI